MTSDRTLTDAINYLFDNPDLSINELKDLAASVKAQPRFFDGNLEYAPQGNLFNSGFFTENIESREVTSAISQNIQNGSGRFSMATIRATDASDFVRSTNFIDVLEEQIIASNPTFNQAQIDAEITRIIDTEIFPEISAKYAASVEGAVKIIAPDINTDGILAQQEIPELINNTKVTTINGIERQVWLDRYTEAFDAAKAQGLSDIDATNTAKVQIAEDISLHARTEGLRGLDLDIDPNDGSLKGIGVDGDFLRDVDGANPIVINNPVGEVHSTSSLFGELDAAQSAKLASLGDFLHKAGIVGTVAGLYFMASEAKAAYDDHNYQGAANDNNKIKFEDAA